MAQARAKTKPYDQLIDDLPDNERLRLLPDQMHRAYVMKNLE